MGYKYGENKCKMGQPSLVYLTPEDMEQTPHPILDGVMKKHCHLISTSHPWGWPVSMRLEMFGAKSH